MKACPLELAHPSQAEQLKGIGPKLCQKLTERLQQYCVENGLPMPKHPKGETYVCQARWRD